MSKNVKIAFNFLLDFKFLNLKNYPHLTKKRILLMCKIKVLQFVVAVTIAGHSPTQMLSDQRRACCCASSVGELLRRRVILTPPQSSFHWPDNNISSSGEFRRDRKFAKGTLS